MGKNQMNVGKSRLGTFSGALPIQNWFFKTQKNVQMFKDKDQKRTSFKVINQISREHRVLFM